MADIKPHVRVFTEVDAVLDTRLGLLRKYYPDVVDKLDLTAYGNRQIDEFPGVSYAEFKKKYDARGDDALEYAVLTNIMSVLNTTLHGAYVDSINLPVTTKPELIINLWPYTFSPEEAGNFLAMFQINCGSYAYVSLVNIPPKDITPQYMKTNVDYMVIYNANAWLTVQDDAFQKNKIPDKKVLCPALYVNAVPTEAELTSIGTGANPFELIQKVMAPILGLSFSDVDAFSVHTQKFMKRIYGSSTPSVVEGSSKMSNEFSNDDIENIIKSKG